MTNIDINKVTDIKKNVVKAAGKGFKYYLASIVLCLSLIVGAGMFYCLINHTADDEKSSAICKAVNSNKPASTLSLIILLGVVYGCGRYINRKDEDTREITRKEDIANAIMKKQDERIQFEKAEHDRLLARRLAIGPLISNILKQLLIELDASKVCVLEMHNGTNNITGLPFLYADMMYEEAIDPLNYTIDEYKNTNLSKYVFIQEHIGEGSWFGKVDDVRAEDPRLAAKLDQIGAKYCKFFVLQGIDRPVGFLNVFFNTEDHPDDTEILHKVAAAGQKLSLLLDKNHEIEHTVEKLKNL